MANVVTDVLARNIELSLIGHSTVGIDGPLYGAFLGLFTAGGVLSPQTVLGDLTEADFTGYARVPITWTAPYQQPDGSFAVNSQLADFQPTDAVVPNTITGAMVIGSDSVTLLYAEQFDEPVPLPDALSALLYTTQYANNTTGNNAGSGTIVT